MPSFHFLDADNADNADYNFQHTETVLNFEQINPRHPRHLRLKSVL